ncbi:MAG: transcription termination factor NusA [Patescibacteria group bacterium]|jgi:N utilization substance protein A
MSQSPIMAAIQQICQEKNISVEAVIETIEAALSAAYRKDFGQKNQNIKVIYDAETGGSRVFDVKIVVEDELKAKAEAEAEERRLAIERGEELPVHEEVELAEGEEAELRYNPKLHISLTDAKEIKDDAVVGEEIRVELSVPAAYGRMAAQTAKQVIIQRLREAERSTIFEEYKDKEGTVLAGTVQRREGPNVLIDLARATGILRPEEQIERERYNTGERLKVFVMSVALGSKGPEINLSRKSPEIVRELFAMEIPEIANRTIEIKGIAREAGSRSKVAVHSDDSNIDPIGSCVGQRGSRVQTIIAELGGEKIDIIEWSEDLKEFITHAMLPAKILGVEIAESKTEATVSVATDQLSLAIGRSGQNVRLASRLSGCRINIVEVKGDEKRVISAEEIEQGLIDAAKLASAGAAEKVAVAEPESISAVETEVKVEEVKPEEAAEPKAEKKPAKKKRVAKAI